MRLGELLIGQGLVTPEDVEIALQRQKQQGGRLGNHLIAMGVLTVDDLIIALGGLQGVASTLQMSARAYQCWEVMRGSNHLNTHRARYSYARALLAAGRSDESLQLAEAALAGFRASLGENHAWTTEGMQLAAAARRAVRAKELHSEASVAVA